MKKFLPIPDSPEVMRTCCLLRMTRTPAARTLLSFGVCHLITTKKNTHLHVTYPMNIINKNIHFFRCFSDFHLVNKSLPWDYDFRFVIEEISNINDKAQVRRKLLIIQLIIAAQMCIINSLFSNSANKLFILWKHGAEKRKYYCERLLHSLAMHNLNSKHFLKNCI